MVNLQSGQEKNVHRFSPTRLYCSYPLSRSLPPLQPIATLFGCPSVSLSSSPRWMIVDTERNFMAENSLEMQLFCFVLKRKHAELQFYNSMT
jgi:hypothetical protein